MIDLRIQILKKVSKKVALDLDDVCVQFFPGMCKRYDKPEIVCDIWDGFDVCRWILESMHEVDNDPEFYPSLDVLSNPKSITFDVECYITSSPEKFVEDRRKWLVENGFPDRPVIHSKNKLKTMRELGIDILVDDRPKTVRNINKSPDKMAVQFVPPYMSEIDDERFAIRHLSELTKFL